MLTLAFPKGRIAGEFLPLLKSAGILTTEQLKTWQSCERRFLISQTALPNLQLVEVKNWDVATFVASGAADLGILGRDIMAERGMGNLYAPLDLKIGKCRLSVAIEKSTAALRKDGQNHHQILNHSTSQKLLSPRKTIASKYPNLTYHYYQRQQQEIDIIPLTGSLELAPKLQLADEIVDLVATGKTLQENGLIEKSIILEVTSLLVVNRVVYKTKHKNCQEIIKILAAAVV